MTPNTRRALLASAWLAIAPAPPASGQDAADVKATEPPKDAKAGKGKWVPLFDRHADGYAITAGAAGRAKRLPEPVLRWWQPVRGGDDGALYLWVRDGRPVAVVTFFTFKWPDGKRSVIHERHSLAAEPLEATWRGVSVWRTSQPGVTFRPVPDAPTPAGGAPARLRQMQAIVRDVSANTVDDKNSTWPLRPLSRPLYRDEGRADGALFALAQGTDPEAFLLLEARGEGDAARWEYAVARFTDLELHVRYKGREVFSGPHTLGGPGEIYHSISVIDKASDSPADFD